VRLRSPSVTSKPVFASRFDPVSDAVATMLAGIKPLPNQRTDAGIVIPETRSTKQRNFAYCSNPECAENGLEFRFEVEHTLVPCPKCGATKAPMVGMLAKVHLLVRDKRGPLEGASGLRYRVACDPSGKRATISTMHNHELATDDRGTANCLDCLIAADKANAEQFTGNPIHFVKDK
jgi:hypothetical protein